MYGVALRGLSLFRLADFAMMSSLCFIWKSILQYLQLQPFVFFSSLSSTWSFLMFTQRPPWSAWKQQLRLHSEIWKNKKKTEEEERKKLSVFVRVLFKNKRKHSHMRLQVTQSFPTQMSRGLLTESETLETSAHRDNPQHSVMRWSILNGQTCECNHLAIWNSFHLNSGYRQLWAFIHQRLLSSTTFCREMFLNSRVASDVLRLDLLFLRERCFKLGLRAATVVKGSVQL